MNTLALMRADARLDPRLRFDGPRSEFEANPRAILLTGATGFLGAFLLEELLNLTGADVYCLVRAASAEAARTRLLDHLRASGVWRDDRAERLVALPGDLSKPSMGLSETDYAFIAERVDAIYHNGAWINALLSYEDLRAINVLGTAEVLRLAGTGSVKPIHYVSTLAIFFGDAHAGQVLTEDELPEADAGLKGGYKQSKWVAESLVREAGTRGLPTTVHRPGKILGHSGTGHNSNLRDTLCIVLKACVLIGAYPDVDSRIDVTPVDHVARAIVQLSREAGAPGRAFHICNPEPVAWTEFMGMVEDSDYPLARMAYPDWIDAIGRASACRPDEPVFRQLRLLLRSPIHLFANTKPHFSAEATHHRLRAAGLACPRLDASLMATYLAAFQRCGFLPVPDAGRAGMPPGGRSK
ncbi:MAG: thioester reductase domain-containing protein [Methylococcus sp.]